MLGNIEAEVLNGICLVAYTVFDEASTRFKVDSGDSSTNTNAKKKDDNLAKMLHGRLWIGMAVQGSLTNGKIVLLSREMALPLMSMSSTSAETMYKALQQRGAAPALSLLSGKFKMDVNAATADKAASNLRLLLAHRFLNPHAASFTTFCRIHCLATMVGRSTKLTQMELDVSGIVRSPLSLRGSGSARDLREHMARTLMVRLGEKDLPPLPSHHPDTMFRDKLLSMLLPGPAPVELKRRQILEKYTSTITAASIAYHGRLQDKDEVVRLMAHAILPSAIPVFQRGRWLKNTAPWREVTLFFFYAGTETLQSWLADFKGTESKKSSWLPLEDALVPYIEPLEDDGPKGTTAEQEESETWAMRNRNNQRALLAFAETYPTERLLMHVILLRAGVWLNDAYLVASSMVWMQQAAAACISDTTACKFRILEAHRGTLGKRFFRTIGEQLESEDTCNMVSTCMEYKTLTYAFAAPAKLGGGVFFLIMSAYRGFPYRLFRL